MKKILYFFVAREDEERLVNISKLLLLNMLKKEVKYFKISTKDQLFEIEKFISHCKKILEYHLLTQVTKNTTILLALLLQLTEINIFQEK